MRKTTEQSLSPVKEILALLERGYLPQHPAARFDAFRSSRWSIRIRIVDPDVANLDLHDRDQPVWDLFDSLPDKTFQMISLLFVLTPDELGESPTNRSFESCRKEVTAKKTSETMPEPVQETPRDAPEGERE